MGWAFRTQITIPKNARNVDNSVGPVSPNPSIEFTGFSSQCPIRILSAPPKIPSTPTGRVVQREL